VNKLSNAVSPSVGLSANGLHRTKLKHRCRRRKCIVLRHRSSCLAPCSLSGADLKECNLSIRLQTCLVQCISTQFDGFIKTSSLKLATSMLHWDMMHSCIRIHVVGACSKAKLQVKGNYKQSWPLGPRGQAAPSWSVHPVMLSESAVLLPPNKDLIVQDANVLAMLIIMHVWLYHSCLMHDYLLCCELFPLDKCTTCSPLNH